MTDDATPATVRLTDGLGPLVDAEMAAYYEGYYIDHDDAKERMWAFAATVQAAERERCGALLVAIREHWVKANGADSLSVGALDVIAEVIADGSYVDGGPNGSAQRPASASPLSSAALDAAVAAERERCARICEKRANFEPENTAITLHEVAEVLRGA